MKRYISLVALSYSGCFLITGAFSPTCGDGFTQDSEQCDDGNKTSGDGCDSECRIENNSCGNSLAEQPEECDDGNQVNGDGCDNNCTPTGCGNQIITSGEECDDGNSINGDGCHFNCSLEDGCGDGVVETPEECDDGNQIPNDSCSDSCLVVPQGCGDGITVAPEQCDDANNIDGDGCESNCKLICGGDSGALRAKLSAGNCYLSFTGTIDWQSAEDDCITLRGHLVVISTQQENSLARSLLPTTFGPWIGVRDTAVEGTFVNITQESLTFINFDQGQPDDGGAGEDCVHIVNVGDAVLSDDSWNDAACTGPSPASGYICELEADPCGDNVVQPPEQCDGGVSCSSDCIAQ